MNEAKAEETWWRAYWHRDIPSAAWRLSKEESSGALLWTLHFIPAWSVQIYDGAFLWTLHYACMSVQICDGVSQGWFLLTFSTHSPQLKLPVRNQIGSFWGKGRLYFSENVAFGTDLDDPLSSHLLRQRRQTYFSKHDFLNASQFTHQFTRGPLNMNISMLDAGFGAISLFLEVKNIKKPHQTLLLLLRISWNLQPGGCKIARKTIKHFIKK